eukprot:9028243-Pyramimonas_sp.AAC.1
MCIRDRGKTPLDGEVAPASPGAVLKERPRPEPPCPCHDGQGNCKIRRHGRRRKQGIGPLRMPESIRD